MSQYQDLCRVHPATYPIYLGANFVWSAPKIVVMRAFPPSPSLMRCSLGPATDFPPCPDRLARKIQRLLRAGLPLHPRDRDSSRTWHVVRKCPNSAQQVRQNGSWLSPSRCARGFTFLVEGGTMGSRRRWSALQKREVVLRLLRGESLEVLSRETQISTLEIERWRRRFLEAGRAGLRERASSWEGRELQEARSTILELQRRLERLECRQEALSDRSSPEPHSNKEDQQHLATWRKEGTQNG